MNSNTKINRRAFLAGSLSLAGVTPAWGAPTGLLRLAGSGTQPTEARPQRLVLLQLSGGNDGVSTIVPFGDDAYHASRKTTHIAAKEVLPIDRYRGFHPRLGSLRGLFDDGRLAIVEGAGYPQPILSHFKCLEVWHTARHAGRSSGEGWISRLVENTWPSAPSTERVVHFGSSVPYSVYSTRRPAINLESPSAYQFLGSESGGRARIETGQTPVRSNGLGGPGGSGGSRALDRLRKIMRDADDTSGRIREAAFAYGTPVEYPDSALGHTLKDVAALIASSMETRVFSLAYGGFDTHAGQLGAHNNLMSTLDGALGAFVRDLARSEAGRETVVLVFSEFGRRLKENGSRGHDHGKAGPMFVLGERVRGGLYGRHPSLSDLDNGDLRFTTDFRSVYATLIKRWFGADDKMVLGERYPQLDLLRA
jgi:uncharacterized protein (DUF1501 family)